MIVPRVVVVTRPTELEAALAEWRKWVERGVRHEESVRVSEEAQERLKALGYLE